MKVGPKRNGNRAPQGGGEDVARGKSIEELVASRSRALGWCFQQAKRHKFAVVVLGVIVGALIVLATKKKDDPFRNFPKTAQNAPSTEPVTSPAALSPQDGPRTSSIGPAAPAAATPTAGAGSVTTLFDPADPNTEPQYRLPARLSTEQVHQFCVDLDVLDKLVTEYMSRAAEYSKIQEHLNTDDVRQALFKRVSSGVGFKYPELSLRWSEFAKAEQQAPWEMLVTGYAMLRLSRIQGEILDASFTQGDVKFVEYATAKVGDQVKDLLPWVNNSRHLERWLLEDGIVDKSALVDGYAFDLPDAAEFVKGLRTDAEERLAPPRPLSPQEQTEMVAAIDALRQRPPQDPGDTRKAFYVPPSNGMLRSLSSSMERPERIPPIFRVLEKLEYTRICCLYRRQAFKQLLPFLFAARTAGKLNDPNLEPKIHALLDRGPRILQKPTVPDPNEHYVSADQPELMNADQSIVQVSIALNEIKTRIIAGKADSRDRRKLNALKAWVDAAFKTYASDHEEMEGLVVSIRKSNDPRLVNAVAAKRLFIVTRLDDRGPMDQAQFSEEPYRLYGAGSSPYPARDKTVVDDYPDFGVGWNSDQP